MEIYTHYFVWRRTIHTERPLSIMRKVSSLGQSYHCFCNSYLFQNNRDLKRKAPVLSLFFFSTVLRPKGKRKTHKLVTFLRPPLCLERIFIESSD